MISPGKAPFMFENHCYARRFPRRSYVIATREVTDTISTVLKSSLFGSDQHPRCIGCSTVRLFHRACGATWCSEPPASH